MHKIRIHRKTEKPERFKITVRRRVKKPESDAVWIIKRWLCFALGCIIFYGALLYVLF